MNGREELLQEALEAGKPTNYNGIYLLPTGSGKGKLMITIAKELDPFNIVYTCDSTELRDKTFVYEMNKWGAEDLIERTDRHCYAYAHKLKGEEWELLLADEFDYSLTPKYSKFYTNNTFDTKVLATASLDKKKEKQALKIAPIVFQKKQVELIDRNILNNIQCYFIYYNLYNNENRKYIGFNEQFKNLAKRKESLSPKKYSEQLQWIQIARKHFLSSLDSSKDVCLWLKNTIGKNEGKLLIFSGLSKQADRLSPNSYHSNNENEKALRDFEKGMVSELAVVDKITRGVNVPGIRNIINESVDSSKTAMIQKTGRGMRLLPNETLHLYFLIPKFSYNGKTHIPTIVEKWVQSATEDIDTRKIEIYNYN